MKSPERTRIRPELGAVRSHGAGVVVFMVAAMAGASAMLADQQPPRFSGGWTNGVLDSPVAVTGRANRPDGQLQVGTSAPHLTIRQDTKVIEIIEDRLLEEPNRLVYHLDGSVAKNSLRLAPRNVSNISGKRLTAVDARVPAEYISKWKDGRLVSAITVQVPGEDGPRRYEETISLGLDGNLSVRIERVGSGDSRTLYYKKESVDRRRPDTPPTHRETMRRDRP